MVGTVKLNNFWGAEIGGLEEATLTSGVPSVSSVRAHSGKYSYLLSDNADTIQLHALETGDVTAGVWTIFGFAVYRPSGAAWAVSILENEVSNCIEIACNTSGLMTLDDANNDPLATESGTASDSWLYIEVYFVHAVAGAYEVFINDISVMSGDAQDFFNFAPVADTVKLFNSGSADVWIDDVYFMSGASDVTPADRLGSVEVLAFRSNKGSNVPDDSGDNLHVGTWNLVQGGKFLAAAPSEYTSAGAGAVDTDDIGVDLLGVMTYGDPYDFGGEDSVPVATFWNSSGAKLFMLGRTGGDINRYSASPAYVVEGLSADTNVLVVSGEVTTEVGLFVSSDGTKVFVVDQSDETIYRYTCTTGDDMGSGSFDTGESYTVTEGSGFIDNVFFKPDGTKMYAIRNGIVYQYSLSTAWQLSSGVSYESKSWDPAPLVRIVGFVISSDGLSVMAVDTSGLVATGVLSIAWDIDTAPTTPDSYGIGRSANIASVSLDGKTVVQIDIDDFGWQVNVDPAFDVTGQTGGGPNGAVEITGTIQGYKGSWYMQRSGGGGSAHYGLLGNNVDGAIRSIDFNPPATYGFYSMRSGLSTVVPLSTEYCRIGFETTGNQDFECAGMLAQILHSPASVPGAIIYKPNRLINNFLMR